MKNITLLITLLGFSLFAEAQDWHIYIGDTELNHIRRMTDDGLQQETLFTINTSREIEMDEVNDKFWYVDADLNQIRKCNSDGSSNTLVLGGLGNPNSIFLDHLNDRFFYSDAADSSLHVCDWDGGNDFEIIQGEGRVTHVEYDYCCDKLYWSDYENSRIARVNLDGSGSETAVAGIDLPKNFEIDAIHQKLYWVTSGEDAKVVRSNMDGSDQEDIYTLEPFSLAHINIDHDNEVLYCSESSLLQLVKMNLDGTEVQLVSDAFLVTGQFAVVSCEPLCSKQDVNMCSNIGYEFAGNTLYDTGQYFDQQTAVNGCDSLSILNLQFQLAPETGVSETYYIEAGDVLEIEMGEAYDNIDWSDGTSSGTFTLDTSGFEAGEYVYTYSASSGSFGCDAAGTFIVIVDTADHLNALRIHNSDLKVHPNPMNNKAFVSYTGSQIPVELYLIDGQGRRLQTLNKASQNGAWLIERNDLSNGLYFVNVLFEDGHMETNRVIVH